MEPLSVREYGNKLAASFTNADNGEQVLIRRKNEIYALVKAEQVRIMTITNRADDYAYQLKDRLEKEGMRVSVDDRNEKIGFKVREAQTQKIPYMLVLGDQEVENGTAALRSRKNENFGAMPVADIIAKLREEIDSKAR